MVDSPIELEVLELLIPFRFKYGHAKARHEGVQMIVCIAKDAEGREGLGEAVPRTYVTGETTASIQQDLPLIVERLRSQGEQEVREIFAEIEGERPHAVPNSAFCAVELALSDLRAQQSEEPLFGGEALTYTASIGMANGANLMGQLLIYKAMGLRHFKVKVGNEYDQDRVRMIRRVLGREVTLFADANGAWDKEEAVRRIEDLAVEEVWAVEEPLRVKAPSENRFVSGQLCRGEEITDAHLQANAWVQARAPVPLIADESLISLPGAQRIIDQEAFQIFNVRLSKCGGFARSEQFAALATQAGLSFSLGAMVGESPILANAGTAFGATVRDQLYIQGHSHRLLHGVRFVEGGPTLGRRGICLPNVGPGAGLRLSRQALAPLIKGRMSFNL